MPEAIVHVPVLECSIRASSIKVLFREKENWVGWVWNPYPASNIIGTNIIGTIRATSTMGFTFSCYTPRAFSLNNFHPANFNFTDALLIYIIFWYYVTLFKGHIWGFFTNTKESFWFFEFFFQICVILSRKDSRFFTEFSNKNNFKTHRVLILIFFWDLVPLRFEVLAHSKF